ncbi:MAG: glycosyltransferase family A protein [Pseudomonadota bacterium]
MEAIAPLSIVIPTYRRGPVLVQTVEYLLEQQPRAAQILLLDQTELHAHADESRLQAMAARGLIDWIRLEQPSIPRAMNAGLMRATSDLVLFLDDDIRPDPELVLAHWRAHQRLTGLTLVAGRVLQPWHEGVDQSGGTDFHFASEQPRWIGEFMGGNFSMRREHAVALGGFDENFVRVAYRFEAEFAHRFLASGGRIHFEPGACLHHLKAGDGGTRTYGEHLTTWRPDHAVGAYYYGLRTGHFAEFFSRPWKSVATRHHLRHPWQIPRTLLAEIRGMVWAWSLFLRGPALVPLPPRNERR